MQTKTKIILIIISVLITPAALTLLWYLVWDKPTTVNSGIYNPVKTVRAHDAEIWAAKYSRKGHFFATGSVDSTVKIWDTSGTLIRTLKQPEGITSLDINANDSLLATGSYDGRVRIWEVSSGKLLHDHKAQAGTVWSVAFNPATGDIASAGEDKNIRIMDVATGIVKHTFRGHVLNIWTIKFTPAGDKIISASFDKTMMIWNAHTGVQERVLSAHSEAVVELAVSHDGKILAGGSDDKAITLWDINSGKLLKTLVGGDEHVQALAFSHDGTKLLSGGRDKSMPGELLQNFIGDSERNKGVSMRLWDLKTYSVIQTFSEHSNDVNEISISNDDSTIISASSDKTVRLWKMK